MSYNLSSVLYKIKNPASSTGRILTIILEQGDYPFSVESNNLVLSEYEATQFLSKFKKHVRKMEVPYYDYYPLLKNKTKKPEKYVRLDLFSDVVSFVQKDLLDDKGESFFHENIDIFSRNEVIYIYDQPEETRKEVNILLLEEIAHENSCFYIDRKNYTNYLPPSVNGDNDIFIIDSHEQFEEFKSHHDFKKENKEERPMLNWTFDAQNHIIMVTK